MTDNGGFTGDGASEKKFPLPEEDTTDDVIESNVSNSNTPAKASTVSAMDESAVEVVPADKEGGEDEQAEAEEQARRDQDPFFFCRWISERPGLWFGITLSGQLFFLFLVVVLAAAGVNVAPFSLNRFPLEILDDVDYLRGLAWDEKDKDTGVIQRGSGDEGREDERTEFGDVLTMLFQDEDNVFTQENLQTMKEVEDEYFSLESYQTKYCLLEEDDNENWVCSLPESVIRYFDGSKAYIDPIFYDPGFNNIVAVLNEAYNNDETAREFRKFLGKNGQITPTRAYTDITKTLIYIGLPLAGYINTTDRESEQTDKLKEFSIDELDPIGSKYYSKGAGKMNYYYNSIYLLITVILKQLLQDLSLAIGSLLFIFVFMCIQTQSLWVTSMALFSILTGFATTLLIYRFILDYRYLGVFHVLAVFIILGIGADDVFVFFDTWKQSGHQQFKSVAHRMSSTYKKAARAMFFTSATTATAFIVSASSPFLSVSSFGVFAGVLVLVNYVTVIVFFPTVVMTYHTWWEKYKCCCCCNRNTNVSPSSEAGTTRANLFVRFFKGPYHWFITQKIARIFILIGFVIFVAVFIFLATGLKVNEEQVKLFRENSNFGKYLSLSGSAFKESESRITVQLIWGLKEQDLGRCHKSDIECFGDTVWDDSFDMNSDRAQRDIRDLCNTIKRLPADRVEEMAIKLDLVTGIPEVDCFIDDMSDFYDDEGSKRFYSSGTTFSYPLDDDEVEDVMAHHPQIYDRSRLGSTFNRHFEIGMSYWLFNGFEAEEFTQLDDYDEWLGELPQQPYHTEITLGRPPYEFTYEYGTRLRYMTIAVNLTLDPESLGYPKGSPVRDAWEEFATYEISRMSPGLKGGYQATPSGEIGFNAWHWLKVQKELVRSAYVGIIIGIAVALPILVIATHNIIVGIYATLTLIIITTCVLGFIPAAGWKLGLLESLNLVLVVGLSVDYVVHLAEGYSRSLKKDRRGRARDMLEEVGISVLSGAVTTLGSSMFLLAAQIVFLYQFGIFIFFTILFSICFALGLFTTFVALAGPENETGSLLPLFRKIKGMIKKK